MNRVLIDTDVILDFFFDRKPYSDYAARMFSLCEKKEISGFVTPVIISNTYYLLRKTSRHENVIEKLNQLIFLLDVLLIDKEVIMRALNSSFRDFEDAIQNFTAERENCIDVILTRNTKDYKSSRLAILTPEIFLKSRIASR